MLAIGRRQEAELKMVRFSVGMTTMDRIRNEGPHRQEGFEKKLEARLRWFGQVQRRGRRPRGWPKRRFMDAVKEDVQIVGVRVEDTKNRVKWKTVKLRFRRWDLSRGPAERDYVTYGQEVLGVFLVM